MSFYVSTATFFLLHCDEWDRVVALPRHKFVTGATLLQLWADLHFSEEKFGESYLYNNNQTLTNRKAGINPYFDHLSVRINLLFSHERRFSP